MKTHYKIDQSGVPYKGGSYWDAAKLLKTAGLLHKIIDSVKTLVSNKKKQKKPKKTKVKQPETL